MRTYQFAISILLITVGLSGCKKRLDGPTPSAASLDPNLVCTEQLTTSVVLHGKGLSPLTTNTLTSNTKLNLPAIALVPEKSLDGSATSGADVTIPDDPNNPAASHVSWQSQQQMTFDVFPALGLTPGVYGVRVTNNTGKSGEFPNMLLAVPPPVLNSVDPDLICNADGARSVTLHGSNFLVVGTEVPSVDVGGTSLTPTYAASDCSVLPGPLSGVQLCSAIDIEIPTTLATGTYPVTVTNPAPANCTTTQPKNLFVVPPPTLSDIEPVQICMSGGDTNFTVSGDNFLDIDGNLPTVEFANSGTDAYTAGPTAAADMSGCSPMTGPTETVQVCSGFTFTLPQDASASSLQSYDVRVTNPDPAGCDSATLPVTNVPPPTVTSPTSATPGIVCQGGGSINITGSNLRTDSTVAIGGVQASNVTASGCDANGLCTSVTASFGFLPNNLVASSPVDLTLTNGDSCPATISGAVTVDNGVLLVYSDPPVIYDGFDNTLTVYAAKAVSDNITKVDLAAPDGTLVTLCDDSSATLCSSDLSKPSATGFTPNGRFNVTVPANFLQTNFSPATDMTFAMQVTTAGDNCVSVLPDAVRIVSQVTATTTMTVTPEGGQVGVDTPITITMQSPTPGLFVATPRAYLTASGGTSGAPLEAVVYDSNSELKAIVPGSLPAGGYDLTIVNPDGTVYAQAYDATTNTPFYQSSFPPPRIDTITPGQLPATAGLQVAVTGDHFENTASEVATAKFGTCVDSTGATFTATTTIAVSTTDTVGQDAQNLQLSFDAPTNATAPFACIIEITNPRDGTHDDFSALAFGNSSGNVPILGAAGTLTTPRRALGVAVVPATRAAHYLYAVGGDDGTAAGAMDSVEYAPLALTGQISQPFTTARYHLNTARTYLGLVRTGNVLYAIGGEDANGNPLSSVERAVVLDPTQTVSVDINDFGFGTSQAPGLAPGLWAYKVAIVFADTDPINPCGESLPSEAFALNVPKITNGLTITLGWAKPTLNANRVIAGYRVYRTPAADSSLDNVEWLNDVDGADTLTYLDDGQAVASPTAITGCSADAPTAGQVPLALGETSKWVDGSMPGGPPQLNEARAGAGVTVVNGRGSEKGMVYVYAMAGLGAAGNTPPTLGDYELLTLDETVAGTNAVDWEGGQSTWSAPVTVLGPGTGACAGTTNAPDTNRWQAGLFAYNHENSSVGGTTFQITGDEQFLLLGAGLRTAANGSSKGDLDSWLIGPNGILDDGSDATHPDSHVVDCQSSARDAGYGNIAINAQMFAFGGDTSATTTPAPQDGINAAPWGITAGTPDTLHVAASFNNNGGARLTAARYLEGTVLDRAFTYAVGGLTTDPLTGALTVSDTIDYGLW